MKYLKQFAWIMLVTCIGEIMKYYIPLPIPASIYGMCLMLFLLASKVIKMEDVKSVATFLVEIMPVMFIPAAVGVIATWDVLQDILLPVLFIVFVSTIIVMVVSGRVTQYVIEKEK